MRNISEHEIEAVAGGWALETIKQLGYGLAGNALYDVIKGAYSAVTASSSTASSGSRSSSGWVEVLPESQVGGGGGWNRKDYTQMAY